MKKTHPSWTPEARAKRAATIADRQTKRAKAALKERKPVTALVTTQVFPLEAIPERTTKDGGVPLAAHRRVCEERDLLRQLVAFYTSR